jgi:hypothetical protein
MTGLRLPGVLLLIATTLTISIWHNETYALEEPSTMTLVYDENKFAGMIGMDFRFIYATGPFVEGTAERFRDFAQRRKIKEGAVVVLDSDGGSVADALTMGRIIRQMGFETEVSTHCFSACTLAFLGGVRRTVAAKAKFGVHRVSTVAPLESAQALDMGQIAIAEVVEYSAFMGVDPNFVSELVAAGPNEINILSHDQLLKYKIISRLFTTKWEIKARYGLFYLMAATETNNRYHKMIFICDGKGGIDIDMLYNASAEYKENALKWTSNYSLEIDGKEFTLLDAEIKEPVQSSGEHYVSVVVHVSDRIYRAFRAAQVVRFMMLPPSRMIYAGLDTDFASGRDQYFEFQRTCRR